MSKKGEAVIEDRAAAGVSPYDACYARREEFVRRQDEGQVVIWPQDREWDYGRQGKARWYLNPGLYQDTCTTDWYTFAHEIPGTSGKHRHQGGLAIFVLDGEGTTTLDEVPYDWEAGDLLILPVKENGVVHQHMSRGDKPALWVAFINNFIWDHVGSDLKQIELSPLWSGHEGVGHE